MNRVDCENCAGTGVSFGKRCTCIAGPRLGTPRPLFTGLADLQRDRARLEWALPMLTGIDDEAADRRALALGAALAAGMDGRDAIDEAMQRTSTKERT